MTPTSATTATSSTRINPTLHPVGMIKLKKISTIIVNAACPAVNDAISGTNAEPNTTNGIRIHSTSLSTPTTLINRAPRTNPIPVPSTARSILVPVVNALLRSTDSAPSTTQNPCSTGNTWVTATANASPRP